MLVRRNGVASLIERSTWLSAAKFTDRVELPLGHQLHHQRPVGDIALYKPVARVRVNARQVVEITGVRQCIEVGDLDRGIGLQ